MLPPMHKIWHAKQMLHKSHQSHVDQRTLLLPLSIQYSSRQVVNLLDVVEHRLKVNLQILEKTVVEAKHPSVHNGELVLAVRLLHVGRLDDVAALLNHVELDQPVISSSLVCDGVELLLVKSVDVTDVSQPRVEEAEILGRHGRLNAATAVVAANDNVLDAKVVNSIVDNAHNVKISVANEVGNVAMDKCLARLQARNLFRGDTRVGASDPQVLWVLAGREVGEEVGVLFLLLGGPAAVVLKEPIVALLEILLDVFLRHCAEVGRGRFARRGGGAEAR